MTARWIGYLADVLFPRACKPCGGRIPSGGLPGLCRDCWGSIRWITDTQCPRCGIPFASENALSHSPDHFCGRCRRKPPRFDRAVSVACYGKALAEAIHLFKYSKKADWAAPMGAMLATRFKTFGHVDFIMPVPLHPRRLRQREYNQSLLLAWELGKRCGVPVRADALRRERWTRPQVELSGEERRRNVRGAFRVHAGAAVQDRSILVVDDVFTTGATVDECARALKRSGAKRVYVLTLARML